VSVSAAAPARPRRRLLRVLGGLTAVHLLVNVLTLATGPLQARLLGPQGRGELALVLVVTGMANAILAFGVGAFLAREVSQGRRDGAVLGTVTGVSLALGALGALCAYPLSRLFAEGQPEVQALIFAGLLLLPIGVTGANLSGAYWGEENWRRWSAMRLLVPALIVAFYVALALLDAFTVVSASVAVFAAGMLGLLPLAPLLRNVRDWRFDRRVARAALGFGAKFNLSAIASQGSQKVDQLLIAALISTRGLGFYVVAASLASATIVIAQGLHMMVMPMTASGDYDAVRRLLRVTLAAMLLAAAILAAAAGPVIELLFGAEFADSAPLARILCLGAVFTAGKLVLSAALAGRGRPGETALVEVLTLAVLIPALALAIPRFGTDGAAVVVVIVSAVGFGALAARTWHWLGGRPAEYLVLARADFAWVARRARRSR
jgi:O-antigen/teichoic acid export membrane protein